MNTENWPLVKLTEEKEAFIQQVIIETFNQIVKNNRKVNDIKDIIEHVIYQERIRIKENPWIVDPEDDWKFWEKTKLTLLETANDDHKSQTKVANEQEILKSIINRYTREICGNFQEKTYKIALKVVPFIFSRLLNSATKGWFKGLFSKENKVHEKVELRGDLNLIRKLSDECTIILVPTHFSNLDPILVGYGIYLADLPPFLYGAGLNLYNNRIVAYFYDRLGAYKLDRRKKNMIYLETLKTFSQVAIERNCHSLFFPGGTRSRSGMLESKVKMGLLGSVIDAQIKNFTNPHSQKKVIILPLIISYHFVLEAPSLVKEHLKKTGKEKFLIKHDQYATWRRILNFVWQLFSKNSKIVLSYGQPMDVLGNYVKADGKSYDKFDREIDVEKYFYSNGKLAESKQRDAEYTEILADKIVEEYKKHNVVLSSHVIAFAAFNIIQNRFKELDLFGLLRIDDHEKLINYAVFVRKIDEFRKIILEYEKEGKLKVDDTFYLTIEEFVEHGLKHLGLYHSKKVLYVNKQGFINTQDLNLLYFYHNRLVGYELEKYF